MDGILEATAGASAPIVPAGRNVPVRAHRSPPRFYDTLLHALSELGQGVVVLEGERFVYANEAFARMVGRSVDELTNGRFSVRRLFAPEDRAAMEARLDRRLAGESAEEHYEGILLHEHGARVHVEVSVKPIAEGDKRLRFAVLRDITDRKRAQQELEEMRKGIALSEKMAALGSLVSGVAHEVRTPLAYVQNHAYVMAGVASRLAEGKVDPGEAAAELKACAEEIQEGVDRVQRLVRDLQKYTRLPSADVADVQLEDVAQEALRLWRETHRGTSVSVVTQLEPTLAVRGNHARLQQVVLNLLDNAHDAMPRGGRVLVATEALPRGARLVVSDEGTGIAPEGQMRIFDPLYTTKRDGMGLGLSIVRRIVELHAGRIEVRSALGEGTSVVVTLPSAYTSSHG